MSCVLKDDNNYALFVFKVKYDVTLKCQNTESTYPFQKTLVLDCHLKKSHYNQEREMW